MKFIFFIILLFPFAVMSQLQLAKIFSDNMVLQRDETIHIWGKGTPGKKVSVTLAKEEKSVTIGNDSSWSIYLSSQKANAQPQTLLLISGSEQITLNNILIGDIWLCFGQSNMQFSMQEEMHFQDEKLNSSQPLIRFYNPSFMGRTVFGRPFTDSIMNRLNVNDFYTDVDWQNCDSNSVKNMSAIGYYFGKEIVQHQNVPIGLINLSIGGAPIETFIPLDALENSKKFSSRAKGNWLMNNALPGWIKERGRQNFTGNQIRYGDEFGPNHGFKPGFAYAAGIEPILGLPIKGALWYQGESNSQEAQSVNDYDELQKMMVDLYRKKWKKSNIPFYWVQLSSIDTASYKSQLWPEFRNTQRLLLKKIDNSGMAVCSDIGAKNNVHPTNKKAVGERLAKWARYQTYKEKIVPSGPLPLTATYKKGNVVVSFQYTAGGLQTSDGKMLRGFSVDGKNFSDARLEKNTVLVPVPKKPKYIYYAWQPFTDANLVNTEQLPASTFKLALQ